VHFMAAGSATRGALRGAKKSTFGKYGRPPCVGCPEVPRIYGQFVRGCANHRNPCAASLFTDPGAVVPEMPVMPVNDFGRVGIHLPEMPATHRGGHLRACRATRRGTIEKTCRRAGAARPPARCALGRQTKATNGRTICHYRVLS
jgi:hypothetical protein